MKFKSLISKIFTLCCILFLGQHLSKAQTNPYKAPLYWSPYEYHITREFAGVSDNYLSEADFLANINWLESTMKPYGYTMVCMDGWGDLSKINENGYRETHSRHWEHTYAWWSNFLQAKGMTLGMYDNPLWLHVDANDTTKKIVGTNINVSSLLDPTETTLWFKWVQVDRPGAEQYVKGYVQHYANMGIKYLRVDFLSWFETGYDRNLGTVGPARTREQYEKALRWMREACDANGMYLSLVMPNLFNVGSLEKQYGHLFRVNEDTREGTWYIFSDKDRGHHYETWSQYATAFDGFVYWSQVSGKNRVQLDGDFIRINTFANDTEKRSVISLNVLAGGPVTISDQYNTIGNDAWLYQNTELLGLNTEKFVGKPLSNDPLNVNSQIWRGQTANGDWVIGLFNREATPQVRSLNFFDQFGITGDVMVRDLWQHQNLGKRNNIQVTVPPHGCIVLRLVRNTTESCTLQNIDFPAIANQTVGAAPFTPNATTNAGLPVEFEIASGPATIVNNQIQLTGTNGTVYVIAKQSGGNGFCAAVPQLQSFNVTGGHQAQMFVGGTFSNWSLKNMTLENNVWKIKNQILLAGAHELKFANTNNFSGDDWGNANGLSGIAQPTTGGGSNITFIIPTSGTYSISFNDLTLEYAIEFTPSHNENMYVGGSFTGWALQQMTLQNDIWEKNNVAIAAGDHELKFANSSNWSGNDWGNATGLSGLAQLTAGGGANISFNIAQGGDYNIRFNDMTLEYEIFNSLSVGDANASTKVTVYPNPADTRILVNAGGEQLNSYRLYDMGGKLIKSGKPQKQGTSSEINVQELPSGVYMLHLSFDKKSSGHRIIIK